MSAVALSQRSPFKILDAYVWSSCYEGVRKSFLNNPGLVLEIIQKSTTEESWDKNKKVLAIILNGEERGDQKGRQFDIILKYLSPLKKEIFEHNTLHEDDINNDRLIIRFLVKEEGEVIKWAKGLPDGRYLEDFNKKIEKFLLQFLLIFLKKACEQLFQ